VFVAKFRNFYGTEGSLCGNMKPLARENKEVLTYIGMPKIV